jgi:carbon monoxide dehydrogenase subunit G
MLLVLAAVLIAIAAVLVVAAARSARFRVERSITIGASPARVLSFIEDLRKWPSWSAEKEDPTATRAYNEVARGVGAVCDWDSRGNAGKGRMEILEASAQRISVRVDWRRPFVASNVNDFALLPSGEATLVTWTLDGENVYILKLMTLFVGADRLMGSHLERGLAALKRACEQ